MSQGKVPDIFRFGLPLFSAEPDPPTVCINRSGDIHDRFGQHKLGQRKCQKDVRMSIQVGQQP